MTQESAKTSRRLHNWLDSWLEYTEVLSSPRIFRKWAGIGILSAVMEQKVWVRTKGSNLYPNTYIILVGPPGVGKSAILSHSERMLRAIPDLFVAPSSLTTASMIDTLGLSSRKIIRINQVPNYVQFNSVQVVASELGVFLPAYDATFMNTLQKLYDREPYEERRRTGKVNHVKLDSPNLTILGGTTPSYLNSFLPEGAWDQGFTSRTIFVYSGEPVYTPIFSEEGEFDLLERLYVDLLYDLKLISAEFGKMSWTKDAAREITQWDIGKLQPIPEHGKLTHYNSRRLAHCIKLCMIAAISRSDSMEITLEDFRTAQDWLLQAEAIIPDIFKSMGVSGDARAIEDTWFFVYQLYQKDQKPVGEHRIVSFLKDRVPSHSIQKIIEIMVRSQILKQEYVGGLSLYKPMPKA